MNYTEIVCMGIKTKDHSDFMNELNLRMILWSTAEAVLRRVKNIINNFLLILWSTAEAVLKRYFLIIVFDSFIKDPMVYCGSGIETQLYPYLKNFSFDPMVYCGSGTETHKVFMLIVYIMIL